MTEKKGNLYKRLITLMEEGNFEYIGSAEVILDDVAKEFPLSNPAKEKDPDYWSELASERLQWFKKNFGIRPK